ncbi:tRNA pseudouridine38-40 synthase [Clostridium sp. USBA 49]|jgi:tRNA pseudouridine38-40 synthase|uniref:tRNA pseudouridine(38-40) synthase TruA n=1 Tax=Clostridium TaxID=1485 RepID=UPI00099A4D87|nr:MULTISPECIES: tRNA pseudouridine(38-40) synthase TruA [Clostridium]SKA82376.1 tRNA pseudouridine38-40 synthase [Clostridium sp. USBA 49]
MRNIKLVIEYDGTNYSGWQIQKNATSVQGKLQETLKKITGEDIEVIGCSRTDAGVHARRFVANFKTESKIPYKNFKAALNSNLPSDIVIINSEEVSLDFHSRYSSKGKLYSYTILNKEEPAAIGRNYVYHYKRKLDVEAMNKACKFFLGTHDFAAFKSSGSSVKNTIRTIQKAYFKVNADKIIFYIEADGFLYNMVRIIVGTLIDVGIHKINPEYVLEIIKSKDRKRASKTVPASGLCLEFVYY